MSDKSINSELRESGLNGLERKILNGNKTNFPDGRV
jgi:hypothetical protein